MKLYLKQGLNLLMKFLSFPYFIIFIILKIIIGKRKAFSSVLQSVSIFPGVSGEWLRRGILQWITRNLLKDCCISFGCLFSAPEMIIGDGVYLGPRCDIGYVKIGKDCVIGSGVHILSGSHQHSFGNLNIPIRDQNGVFEQISIGSDTWIGNNAIIMANVGKGCVIGAGSVVTKPILDFTIVGGNPAKILGSRENKL